MRSPFLLLLAGSIFGFASAVRAQVQSTLMVDPVPAAPKAGDKITARLKVDIDPGWHIYSLTQIDGDGVPSEIILPQGQLFKLAGEIDTPAPRGHSDASGINVKTYEGEVVFALPLVASGTVSKGTKLKVDFTYQACDDQHCNLPQTEHLEAIIGGSPKP